MSSRAYLPLHTWGIWSVVLGGTVRLVWAWLLKLLRHQLAGSPGRPLRPVRVVLSAQSALRVRLMMSWSMWLRVGRQSLSCLSLAPFVVACFLSLGLTGCLITPWSWRHEGLAWLAHPGVRLMTNPMYWTAKPMDYRPCWADRPQWGASRASNACDLQATTDIGLCGSHYREIFGWEAKAA